MDRHPGTLPNGAPPDFDLAAAEYARCRPGFPDAFFDRLRRSGVGIPGQRILDLGTGTGALARGFAGRGCSVVGLDPSAAMLREARDLTRGAGLRIYYVQGMAETVGHRDAAFDVVCAGQCWHWFDRRRASREVARLLRPGGRGLIASLSYLADPGMLGAETEALVLRYHPDWRFSGSDGRMPQFVSDLADQGLGSVETFEFDVEIAFTHEAWRGRFRTCNGVFPLPPETRAAFDADLRTLLASSYPDPVQVRHRLYAILARK